MKKIFTFLALFIYVGINGLSAQPQTENIRRQIKQKGASAHLLTEMARIFSTSQPDSAIHYVKLAQAKKPAGTDLITLNAALGEANMAQGKTEKALQLFTHAQKLAVQQKNQHEQYNQLCSMGICYSRLQKFDQAIKCYEQVINYGLKHSRQLAFSGYQNYAALCSRVGRAEDCKSMLFNALKYEDAAEPSLRVSVYAGLGTILTYTPATFGEAETYLRKGIEIARKANEPLAEASCLSPLITLLTQLPARYGEIPQLITRANSIVSQYAPNGTERMQLEHAKFNFYYVTKQRKLALESALVLYNNSPAVSSERDKVLLMTARAYEGVGQTDRACYFYLEAYYVADSIQQLQIQQQAADAAARYDSKEKQFKIVQLEKDAAQAEVKQWRLGVGLAGALALIVLGGAGVMLWMRQQRRIKQLNEAKRYIDGVETERKRLAQELHDGVCNDLLVAEMKLSVSECVDDAVQQLHHVRNDIRQISHELMPPKMQFSTIDQLLSAFAYKLSEMQQFEVKTEIDTSCDWTQLATQKGYQLYRIVQEHVTNLIKHTTLKHLEIVLEMQEGTVVLKLIDDAQPQQSNSSAPKQGGIGLQSTAERLKSIEAEVESYTNCEHKHVVCIKC